MLRLAGCGAALRAHGWLAALEGAHPVTKANRRDHRSGFTLIELMIVIGIIGILAAILVPNMVRSKNQGRLSACKQNVRAMASAIESYATDNRGRYPSTLNRLSPAFISALPTCPVTKSSSPYETGYESSTGPDNYTISCAGGNHTTVGLPANYPQYNAATGLSDR